MKDDFNLAAVAKYLWQITPTRVAPANGGDHEKQGFQAASDLPPYEPKVEGRP